jgi:hypothetical protein
MLTGPKAENHQTLLAIPDPDLRSPEPSGQCPN